MKASKVSRREREMENLPIVAELRMYESAAAVPTNYFCEKYGVSQPRLAALIRSVFHNPIAPKTSRGTSGNNEVTRMPGAGIGGNALARSYPAPQGTVVWVDPIFRQDPVVQLLRGTPLERIARMQGATERAQDGTERREVHEPEVSYYPRPAIDGEQPKRSLMDPQPHARQSWCLRPSSKTIQR